jgi:hypothetical protein
MDVEYIYNLNYHLCLRCGKEFKHRGLLNRHLKNKNPCNINYIKVSRDELINNYYKVYFKNIDVVKNKILKSSIKSAKTSNQCNFCGKTTKTSRGLNQHVQKYCTKNKKIEYRYENVINSARKLVSDYLVFIQTYKSIKNGTNSVNHPSVVNLVNKNGIIKSLNDVIIDSVPSSELSKGD